MALIVRGKYVPTYAALEPHDIVIALGLYDAGDGLILTTGPHATTIIDSNYTYPTQHVHT